MRNPLSVLAFLIVTACWLFSTLLVDFAVVPTVFRTVPDVFIAGRLGGKLFSIYNMVELAFSYVLAGFLVYLLRRKVLLSFKRSISTCVVLLFVLAGAYTFHISPKIMKHAEAMEKLTDEQGLKEARAEHSFYHHLYVKLDSGKILILAFVLLSMTRNYYILNRPYNLGKDL